MGIRLLARLIDPVTPLVKGNIPMLDNIHWDGLLQLACLHRVSALLYWRLDLAGLIPMLPNTAKEGLKNEFKRYRESSRRYEEEIRDIYNRSRQDGIRFLVLKGLPLEIMLYPLQGIRGTIDLDLLISWKDCGYFKQVLLDKGYGIYREDAFHITLWHMSSLNCVELHLKERSFLDLAEAWEKGYTIRTQTTLIPTLCYEDMFLYLVFHFAKHHFFWPLLIWANDLRLLLAQRDHRLDWGYIEKLARRSELYHMMWDVVSIALRPYGDTFPREMLSMKRPAGFTHRIFSTVTKGIDQWETDVPRSNLWRLFLYLFSYDRIGKGIRYAWYSFLALARRWCKTLILRR
jgi:hypothetical protein